VLVSHVHRVCQDDGIYLLQSELRKRLLERFRQGKLSPEGRKPGSIKEQALNTIIAEYLAASQRTCTLSVFLPEAALSDCAALSHEDIMSILQIRPHSPLDQRIRAALAADKENGNHIDDSCVSLLHTSACHMTTVCMQSRCHHALHRRSWTAWRSLDRVPW
jgi:hypothetical protein